MNKGTRKARAGLTLIEVMLTIVILGIAGIVLVTAVSQSLGVVRAARLYNTAHTLLARVELENPLFEEEIRVGTEQGRFPESRLSQFAWTREITAVGDEEDGLFSIRTQISWTQRGRRGFEEVVQYRFAPEEEP